MTEFCREDRTLASANIGHLNSTNAIAGFFTRLVDPESTEVPMTPKALRRGLEVAADFARRSTLGENGNRAWARAQPVYLLATPTVVPLAPATKA